MISQLRYEGIACNSIEVQLHQRTSVGHYDCQTDHYTFFLLATLSLGHAYAFWQIHAFFFIRNRFIRNWY